MAAAKAERRRPHGRGQERAAEREIPEEIGKWPRRRHIDLAARQASERARRLRHEAEQEARRAERKLPQRRQQPGGDACREREHDEQLDDRHEQEIRRERRDGEHVEIIRDDRHGREMRRRRDGKPRREEAWPAVRAEPARERRREEDQPRRREERELEADMEE